LYFIQAGFEGRHVLDVYFLPLIVLLFMCNFFGHSITQFVIVYYGFTLSKALLISFSYFCNFMWNDIL